MRSALSCATSGPTPFFEATIVTKSPLVTNRALTGAPPSATPIFGTTTFAASCELMTGSRLAEPLDSMARTAIMPASSVGLSVHDLPL